MKIFGNLPNMKNAIREVSWNYNRIFESLKDNSLIILYSIAFMFLVLFVFDSELVERMGTVASVVIAAIVCWMHYDKHIKGIEKKRRNQMIKVCDTVSKNLVLNTAKDNKGNISLKFEGCSGQIVSNSYGEEYLVEWKFDYAGATKESIFQITERDMKTESEGGPIGDIRRIEFRSTSFGFSILSYSGKFTRKTMKLSKLHGTRFYKFDNQEWDQFVANANGTMFEYFQRLIPQSQGTKP